MKIFSQVIDMSKPSVQQITIPTCSTVGLSLSIKSGNTYLNNTTDILSITAYLYDEKNTYITGGNMTKDKFTITADGCVGPANPSWGMILEKIFNEGIYKLEINVYGKSTSYKLIKYVMNVVVSDKGYYEAENNEVPKRLYMDTFELLTNQEEIMIWHETTPTLEESNIVFEIPVKLNKLNTYLNSQPESDLIWVRATEASSNDYYVLAAVGCGGSGCGCGCY